MIWLKHIKTLWLWDCFIPILFGRVLFPVFFLATAEKGIKRHLVRQVLRTIDILRPATNRPRWGLANLLLNSVNYGNYSRYMMVYNSLSENWGEQIHQWILRGFLNQFQTHPMVNHNLPYLMIISLINHLVGGFNPSEKIWKSVGRIIPGIKWKNRTCLKSPTS